MRRLFRNALIINEGKQFNGWLLIDGEIIADLGEGLPSPEIIASADEVTDLDGRWLIPGVIDDQVHFRDPGLTYKADIFTESRAAAAGGVTSFMDMPNTKPQTVTQEALEDKFRLGAEKSLINYTFFPGATNDNTEWLKTLDFSRLPGVKVFLGASTGNMLVDNEKALDEIFSLPAIIAIHSEDEAIIRRNAEKVRAEYGDDAPIELHPQIRSTEACVASTKRAIERAERLGTRLHILHISTAAEAAMLSNKPLKDKKITAEVCVHHLWFTDVDYGRLGTRIKWNPAVKTAADREALREALKDGRIDVVATDHAPHLLTEKVGGCLKATSGGPLVQFSLPVMLELAKQGVFTPEQVVEYMSHRPAELFGIEGRGYLRKGYKADLVVVNPKGKTEINAGTILSKCGWSPLEGETLSARIEETIVNGTPVYRAGRILEPTSPVSSASQALRFNH